MWCSFWRREWYRRGGCIFPSFVLYAVLFRNKEGSNGSSVVVKVKYTYDEVPFNDGRFADPDRFKTIQVHKWWCIISRSIHFQPLFHCLGTQSTSSISTHLYFVDVLLKAYTQLLQRLSFPSQLFFICCRVVHESLQFSTHGLWWVLSLQKVIIKHYSIRIR